MVEPLFSKVVAKVEVDKGVVGFVGQGNELHLE